MTATVVTYGDGEPNGLASMVGGLLEANLDRHPSRRELLKPAVVDISAHDAEVGITLELLSGTVRIWNGSWNGHTHLRIETDSASLIELAASPLRFGLPDLFHAQGRVVARKVIGGQIQIRGVLRHPVRLTRVSRLLSVM